MTYHTFPQKTRVLLSALKAGFFALLALAFFAAASAARADGKNERHFNTLLVFGDSLLDSGNLAVPVPNAPAGVNLTLVFTDPAGFENNLPVAGEVAPDFLAARLGVVADPRLVGGSNYAVAGSNAEHVYAAVMAYTDGLAAANGRIDSNALVVMNGGANNMTIALALAGTDFAAAGAHMQGAATTMRMAMESLHDAGARYVIMQNLPNVAFTPGIYVTPPPALALVSTAAEGLSGIYNEALSANISMARADGANIIVADINGFFNHVIDNLGAYGFENTPEQYQTCYGYDPTVQGQDPACNAHPVHGHMLPNSPGDPTQLLFADNVHPTQRFHGMAGDYMYDITRAPTEIALLPEIGLNDLTRQFAAAAGFLHNGHNAVEVEGARDCFADLQFGRANLGDNGPAANGALDGIGLSAGCAVSRGDYRVGVAAGLARGELKTDGSASEYDYATIGGVGFADFVRRDFFARGLAGFSFGGVDAKRRYRIGSAGFTASSDEPGVGAWGVEFISGYKFAVRDGLEVSPVVGFFHKKSELEGYAESGDGASNYRWHDFESASRTARLGLMADYRGGLVGMNNAIHGEFFLAKEGEDDLRHVTASRANDAAANTYQLPGLQREAETFYQMRVAVASRMDWGAAGLSWRYSTQSESSHLFALNYRLSF